MRNGWVIHHNGPQAHVVGRSHDRCVSFWRGVVNYHANTKGWGDVAYSFGICPHGLRFTGRGWDARQWANGEDEVGMDDGSDDEWYTVLAFVGGGEAAGHDTGEPEEPVTPEMAAGIRDLIAEGRESGRCGDRVLPHHDFKEKACPGPTLAALAAELDRQPLTAPQEDDMVKLDDEDKDWFRALATEIAGDRSEVDAYNEKGTRRSTWRWSGEMVTRQRRIEDHLDAVSERLTAIEEQLRS